MNIERLQELRRFLAALPEERRTKHFDLESWVTVNPEDNYDHYAVPFDKVPHKKVRGRNTYQVSTDQVVEGSGYCGTTACAIGWACSNPVFIKQGLHMLAEPTEVFDEEKNQYIPALDYFTPSYKGKESWDAVVEFFDINYGDAYLLFSEAHYQDLSKGEDYKPTVEDVIQRLDNIINTGKVLPEMV